MGKRKREDDDEEEYIDFCSGLQRSDGNNSYIYCNSRPLKRPRINPNIYKPASVRYRYLDPMDSDYQIIKNLITNNSIVIDDIVEVKNQVLEDAYYAKKEQRRKEFGPELKEALLFHGTKESKVSCICKFNFDWRLTGTNKGHKFGKGVCFSPNAKYSSNYSDRNKLYKVMIVAKVLIAKVCKGDHDMSIPPPGYDTSEKVEGAVLVKYEDNEFYPAYILYYHMRNEMRDHRRRRYNSYYYNHYNENGYNYNQDNFSYYNPDYYSHYGHDQYYGNCSNNYFYNSHSYSDNQNSDYSNDDEHYYNNNSNYYYSFSD